MLPFGGSISLRSTRSIPSKRPGKNAIEVVCKRSRSPTVFNFFSPGYALPGALAQAGLVAPEFEITTETSIFGTANYLHDFIYYGAAFDPYTIFPDYSSFVGLSDADLLTTLDLLLTGNALSSQTLSVLSTAMADPNFSDPSDPTTRVRNLAYLIILSPDFAVQR